ncbi:MAG: Stp1/IreP family PP2C-type Ser/Thr phosphatase [Tissierellia bacterium]|nr:Stp1/IreP family PP2C-type Ser/Thr phosphatase [Tissierellia bacterium]
MDIGVRTDTGRIRENNQDSYYLPSEESKPLFIIADGMGGHKAGEIASNLAINIISENFNDFLNKGNINEKNIKNNIIESFNEANEKIYRKAMKEEECSGMGTTVVLAYISDENLYIGHVGDSRAYSLYGEEFLQITEDHSLVEELIKNGSISKEEAKTHPQRNIITRAVGTSRDIDVDILVLPKTAVEILLLCTDGLTSMLDDNEIKDTLINSENMQIACDRLVQFSNDKGGYDNITVLALEF